MADTHKPENERIHHNGEDYVPAYWMALQRDALDAALADVARLAVALATQADELAAAKRHGDGLRAAGDDVTRTLEALLNRLETNHSFVGLVDECEAALTNWKRLTRPAPPGPPEPPRPIRPRMWA